MTENNALQPIFEYLPIADLEILDENPRDISHEEFENLCKEIEQDPNYFIQRPCLVNKLTDVGKQVIYAGSQRYRAAKVLGYTEVPCFIEENVPHEVQERRMLLDNHHHGKWNEQKLAEIGIENLQSLGKAFMESLNLGKLTEFAQKASEKAQNFVDSLPKQEANVVRKYELVFEDDVQQQSFYDFLAYLREKVTGETHAERMHHFIQNLLQQDGEQG